MESISGQQRQLGRQLDQESSRTTRKESDLATTLTLSPSSGATAALDSLPSSHYGSRSQPSSTSTKSTSFEIRRGGTSNSLRAQSGGSTGAASSSSQQGQTGMLGSGRNMASPPHSPIRGAYDDKDLNSQSIDSLLTSSSPPHSPRFPPLTLSAARPSPAPRIIVLLALLATSAFSSHVLPHAVLLPYRSVVWMPLVQFGAMTLVGAVWRRGIYFGRGERENAMLLGLTSAACKWLEVLQGRHLEIRVWSAVELLVLPAVLLFPVNSHVTLPPIPYFLVLSIVVTTFLTSFSLIGISAAVTGLILASTKVAVEAYRIITIRNMMWSGGASGADRDKERSPSNGGTDGWLGGGAGSGFKEKWEKFEVLYFGSSLFATIISFVPSCVAFLLQSPTPNTYPIFPLVLYTIFSLLAASLYLFALSFLPTVTVLSLYFPRNLLIITFLTFGMSLIGVWRGGQGLSIGPSNWLQMVFVLIGGMGLMAWFDPEWREIGVWLREEGKVLTRRLRKGSPKGYTEVGLPSNEGNGSSNGSGSGSLKRSNSGSRMNSNSISPLHLLFPFIPFVLFVLQTSNNYTISSISTSACAYLPYNIRASVCPRETGITSSRTVDLVFAFYDEDLNTFRDHLNEMRRVEFVRERNVKVIVYNKGPKQEKEIRDALRLRMGDQVVPLQNRGREGATYLKHILSHYNSTLMASSSYLSPSLSSISTPPLADHTFFLQPHLAWDWIARPRIGLVGPSTGFAHFGPMMRSDCGEDSRGNGYFPIVRDLYQIFVGKLCPPTGQLTAWSAQFVVSKRRIMANAYERYQFTDDIIEAPNGHWIHNIWGPQNSGGETAPAMGHSLERAWPIIFGCADPRPADECPDDVHERDKCQCLDY